MYNVDHYNVEDYAEAVLLAKQMSLVHRKEIMLRFNPNGGSKYSVVQLFNSGKRTY